MTVTTLRLPPGLYRFNYIFICKTTCRFAVDWMFLLFPRMFWKEVHCQECFPEMGSLIYLDWNIESMMGRNSLAASQKLVSRLLRQDFWGPSVHWDVTQCFHWFTKGSAKSLVTKWVCDYNCIIFKSQVLTNIMGRFFPCHSCLWFAHLRFVRHSLVKNKYACIQSALVVYFKI